MRTMSQPNIGFGNVREKSFSGYIAGIKPDGKENGRRESRDSEYNQLLNSPLNISRAIRQKLEVIWGQGWTFFKMGDIVACCLLIGMIQ